jgi:hypothetical protein
MLLSPMEARLIMLGIVVFLILVGYALVYLFQQRGGE